MYDVMWKLYYTILCLKECIKKYTSARFHIEIIYYIKLRRPRDGTSVRVFVTCPDPRFIQFTLASCCAVHINLLSIKRIIIKVYIERKNMQVQVISFRKKNIYFIDVGNLEVGSFREGRVDEIGFIAIREVSPMCISAAM